MFNKHDNYYYFSLLIFAYLVFAENFIRSFAQISYLHIFAHVLTFLFLYILRESVIAGQSTVRTAGRGAAAARGTRAAAPGEGEGARGRPLRSNPASRDSRKNIFSSFFFFARD